MLGSLELMRSMTDVIRASGGEPACRDLSIDQVDPSADIAEELELAAGAKIGRIRRVRLMDERPLAVSREYVVLDGRQRTFDALKTFTGGSLLMRELHFSFDGQPALLTINYHNAEVIEFTSMRSGMAV